MTSGGDRLNHKNANGAITQKVRISLFRRQYLFALVDVMKSDSIQ